MTLFNYDKCDMCKLHQNSKKKAMMDILPVDICCKVGEYFGCCRCEEMKENEKHFFKGFTGEINDNTKPSHQLAFFRMFKMPLLSTLDINDKKYKKEIDRIFDKQKVKDKYVFNKMDLQAIKSYWKKDSNRIKLIVCCCHSKKEMDSIFHPFFYRNDNIYTFRNKEYLVSDLAKLFLFEYVDDLIGYDKRYCDMNEIVQHIHKLFRY